MAKQFQNLGVLKETHERVMSKAKSTRPSYTADELINEALDIMERRESGDLVSLEEIQQRRNVRESGMMVTE